MTRPTPNPGSDGRFQRWTCPGRHCGTFAGYQRGCRKDACTAVVPAASARQRARTGRQPRTPLDADARDRLLNLLRNGASLNRAAAAIEVSPFRIRAARRTDPAFDQAVLDATAESGRPQPAAPLRPLNCPGTDCDGRGYAYGCRRTACAAAHAEAMSARPRSDTPPLRRFDQTAAYLEQLRAGYTVEEAARRIGAEYTAVYYRRLLDAEFDAAVVTAAAEGCPAGRPGPRVRPVHRITRSTP